MSFLFLFLFTNFLVVLTSFSSLFSAAALTKMKDVSCEKLEIKSKTQRVVDSSKVFFKGDVEVRLDDTLYVRADRVMLDKQKQKLYAQPAGQSSIICESDDLLILTNRFVYDLATKTGYVKDIRIHGSDGFVSAHSACKKADGNWKCKDIVYTPCDCESPHWSFSARRATLYKNYLIKVSGVMFNIKGKRIVPFPLLMFSLQRKKTSSGFLMPRFYIDQRRGLGIKTEYYWNLGPHSDNTVGLFWRDYKGFVVSNEFRFAQNPETYAVLNGFYGKEWDATVERSQQLMKGTETHYWFSGNYSQPMGTASNPLHSLVRIDIGSDKHFGYRFFNKTQSLEDSFLNSWIVRSHQDNYCMEFSLAAEKTYRRQSYEHACNFDSALLDPLVLTSDRLEATDNVTIKRLPHFTWNTGFKKLFSWLQYRHDVYADYASLKKELSFAVYRDNKKIFNEKYITMPDSGVARCGYSGDFHYQWMIGNNKLRYAASPNIHLRGFFDKNSTQGSNSPQPVHAFIKHTTDFIFPEVATFLRSGSQIFIQPRLVWLYTNNIKQNDWLFIDALDRFYATNALEGRWHAHWFSDRSFARLSLQQGYEFADKKDTFPLRQDPYQKHLLPFSVGFECGGDIAQCGIFQNYSWNKLRLLSSELSLSGDFPFGSYFLSYLYQNERVQQTYALLSDIQHFITIGATIPLGKYIAAHYDGNFYGQVNNDKGFTLEAVKPLFHTISLSYNADCWSITCGYEEKRFRQHGVWHGEYSYILSFRLESLGSFAKRVRRLDSLSYSG